MPKFNLEKIVYRWRVRAASIGLILAIIFARPDLTSFLTGLGICFLGLLIRTWSTGHLRKEKKLAISGPYKYTRNPLYLGNFVIGISVAFASRSWCVLGYFAAYFLLFYPLVIKREMKRMKELFPAFFLYEKIGTPPVIIIQVIDKIFNEIDVFSNAIGFWI